MHALRAAVAAALVAASASLHLPATAPAPITELLYWKRLPLLKFPSHDALLPGEERQVHLYEPALVRLFERTLGPHGIVGQHLEHSSVTPLLRVTEASPHEERGWWMRLCCIGRVEASDVERSAHGYDTASICPYRDEADRVSDDEFCGLTGLGCADDEVCELYDACYELERRSAALEVACAVPPDARYEWGHESYSPAFEERISALVARRRDALLQRGMDEPPAPGLEVLRGVWGAADAELQLLSFAACSSLDTEARTQALLRRSTRERLELAADGLRERRKKLLARVAMEESFCE